MASNDDGCGGCCGCLVLLIVLGLLIFIVVHVTRIEERLNPPMTTEQRR